MVPESGRNSCSGSSAVMRAATTKPGVAVAGESAVTEVPAATWSRTSGMSCRAMPAAICTMAAGRLMPESISETGCSTCRRGLTSRKR